MFRRKDEDLENEELAFGNDNASDKPQATTPTEAPVNDATKKPQAAPAAASAPAAAAATAPTKPTEPSRPAPAANFRPAPAPAPSQPARSTAPAAAAAASAASNAPAPTQTETRSPSPAAKSTSNRILTVGADINMNGEINSCDRLVIEGIVDATLRDVHTVELAKTGSLRGTAEVQDAEISGSFEGDLVVNGRLIIYSTGEVRGNITYGEIEIERGGQLSGNIGQNAAASEEKNKKAA